MVREDGEQGWKRAKTRENVVLQPQKVFVVVVAGMPLIPLFRYTGRIKVSLSEEIPVE